MALATAPNILRGEGRTTAAFAPTNCSVPVFACQIEAGCFEGDATMNKFIKFLKSEDGAVTVDWVVLTAAIVGLGIVVIGTIGAGTTSVSGSLGASLNDAEPPAVDVPIF